MIQPSDVDVLTWLWTGYHVTDFSGRGKCKNDEAQECRTPGVWR